MSERNAKVLAAWLIIFAVIIAARNLWAEKASNSIATQICVKRLEGGPQELSKYHQAIRETTRVLNPAETEEIKGDSPLTIESSAALMDKIMDPDDPVNKSLDAYITALGGMQSPHFWNEYFRAYDRFVGFAPGYSDIFVVAAQAFSRYLAPDDTVADLGCGTGNGTSIILEHLKKLHVMAMDRSGLELAKSKAEIVLGPGQTRAQFIKADLISDPLPGALAGAVMNNVLYTLGDAKAAVLHKIWNSLKPGGIFVLNDPLAFVQNDRASTKKWLLRIMDDAILNGTPATEADARLVATLAVRVAMASPSVWLTSAEMIQLVKSAGFEILESHTVYYEGSFLMVLRKPGSIHAD
jgi:SAM-dependent methyltransferase